MPSFEIVCIGQEIPTVFSGLPFALLAEPGLESHRPEPLFQAEFDQLTGCMYHLGNPGFDDPRYQGMYFAYELFDRDALLELDEPKFVVAAEHLEGFRLVLGTLVSSSPQREVLLTTDWQFGPHPALRGGTLSEVEFWSLHDHRKLRMNACYRVEADESVDRNR